MLEKIEAKLVPPRKWLSAIVDDTDDEAVVKEKQEKALAEHVARHPEDAGRMVEDFNWILRVIMREAEAARAAGIALNGSGKATIGRSGMGKVMVKHKSVKIIAASKFHSSTDYRCVATNSRVLPKTLLVLSFTGFEPKRAFGGFTRLAYRP